MIVQRLIKYMWKLGISSNQCRSLSSSNTNQLNQRWRQERGLPANPNANGVLTDGPDYSFLDGRLTPYGSNQWKRIIKERELRDSIIHLSGEIDFAVERHKQLKLDEEKRKQNILGKKLRAKGTALLKAKT